jgi:hypothetical protein
MRYAKENIKLLKTWNTLLEDSLESSGLLGVTAVSIVSELLWFIYNPNLFEFKNVVTQTKRFARLLTDLGMYEDLAEVLEDISQDMLFESRDGKLEIDIWKREKDITLEALGVYPKEFMNRDYERLENYIRLSGNYNQLLNYCSEYTAWAPDNWKGVDFESDLILVPNNKLNPRYGHKLADASLQVLNIFNFSSPTASTALRISNLWKYLELMPFETQIIGHS